MRRSTRLVSDETFCMVFAVVAWRLMRSSGGGAEPVDGVPGGGGGIREHGRLHDGDDG